MTHVKTRDILHRYMSCAHKCVVGLTEERWRQDESSA